MLNFWDAQQQFPFFSSTQCCCMAVGLSRVAGCSSHHRHVSLPFTVQTWQVQGSMRHKISESVQSIFWIILTLEGTALLKPQIVIVFD